MAGNAKQFATGLRKYATETVPEMANDLQNAVALEVVKGVVRMSPVDSGRLRGAWNVTTDGSIPAVDLSRFDKDGSMTLLRAQLVIQAVRAKWGVLTISNATKYGVHVNNGTARTTAVHMVEATIARVSRIFSRAA